MVKPPSGRGWKKLKPEKSSLQMIAYEKKFMTFIILTRTPLVTVVGGRRIKWFKPHDQCPALNASSFTLHIIPGCVVARGWQGGIPTFARITCAEPLALAMAYRRRSPSGSKAGTQGRSEGDGGSGCGATEPEPKGSMVSWMRLCFRESFRILQRFSWDIDRVKWFYRISVRKGAISWRIGAFNYILAAMSLRKYGENASISLIINSIYSNFKRKSVFGWFAHLAL
jgi:hypothetical protein